MRLIEAIWAPDGNMIISVLDRGLLLVAAVGQTNMCGLQSYQQLFAVEADQFVSHLMSSPDTSRLAGLLVTVGGTTSYELIIINYVDRSYKLPQLLVHSGRAPLWSDAGHILMLTDEGIVSVDADTLRTTVQVPMSPEQVSGCYLVGSIGTEVIWWESTSNRLMGGVNRQICQASPRSFEPVACVWDDRVLVTPTASQLELRDASGVVLASCDIEHTISDMRVDNANECAYLLAGTRIAQVHAEDADSQVVLRIQWFDVLPE